MKEQKIYEVTIIERTEDLHEGSGVVKKVNRRARCFREPISAVSEESAKQKALKACKVDNFDDLEITCSPFCG